MSELVRYELVSKKITTTPYRVEYRLTKKGKELMHIVQKMKAWAIKSKFIPQSCSSVSCADCATHIQN
jgi:DNA-binding HxlR family transcriptional regulator